MSRKEEKQILIDNVKYIEDYTKKAIINEYFIKEKDFTFILNTIFKLIEDVKDSSIGWFTKRRLKSKLQTIGIKILKSIKIQRGDFY